jgi:hypothetical protein
MPVVAVQMPPPGTQVERGLYEELLVTLIDAFTSSAAWLAERIG